MIYSLLLNSLYGDSLDNILSVINESVIANEFISTEDSVVIHTGFSFVTHKNHELELLYDIISERVIRQLRFSNVREINGLIVSKENKSYFNYYKNMLIAGISNTSNSNFLVAEIKNINSLYSESVNGILAIDIKSQNEITITSFKIFDSNNRDVAKEYPLSKRLRESLFYDGEIFA